MQFFYNPIGLLPTIRPMNVSHSSKYILPERVYPEPMMSIQRAWLEYTGLPAMVSGGLGALGLNVGLQAGQVRSGTSLFTAARYGFGLALLLEASIGAVIYATVMTALDPDDLYEGGLLNEPIGEALYSISPEKLIIENPSVPANWKIYWLSPSWS